MTAPGRNIEDSKPNVYVRKGSVSPLKKDWCAPLQVPGRAVSSIRLNQAPLGGGGPPGFTPAGFTPAGFTPAGFTPAGITAGGFTPDAFTAGGITPVGFATAGVP